MAIIHHGVPMKLVKGVDTSKDTVTPEALAHGFTAHDASGKQITGSFVNPYNANTVGDTVTPDTLFNGVTAHDSSGNQITGQFINPYNANTREDTVAADSLLEGVTAHDSNGQQITGTLSLEEIDTLLGSGVLE